MKNTSLKFASVLFLFLLSIPSWALVVSGKVLRIHDGDTITVLLEGAEKNKNVRMLGIDTPEVDYNGHSQGESAILARDYLRSIVPIGSTVQIEVFREKDLLARRILGTVFFQGEDINLKMVESGWAALYFIYPFSMQMVKNYSDVAVRAMESKRGIFGGYVEDMIMPYEFRLIAENRVAFNYVGNIQTMELFSPEDVKNVPPASRIFIRNLDTAAKLGFSFQFE
jgi:micrococcal nuclease